MSSQLLYNNDNLEDVINVLSFINKYTEDMGIKDVVLDVRTISRVVISCKQDFPHNGGIQQASAFKQVANFVCHFVGERPLQGNFPIEIVGNELSKIDNHQNAMVAFALAEAALNNSKIQRKDGPLIISKPLDYSRHSYVDIIDALSSISAATHFKLLSVFFEQLVYKANPECQYKTNGG